MTTSTGEDEILFQGTLIANLPILLNFKTNGNSSFSMTSDLS